MRGGGRRNPLSPTSGGGAEAAGEAADASVGTSPSPSSHARYAAIAEAIRPRLVTSAHATHGNDNKVSHAAPVHAQATKAVESVGVEMVEADITAKLANSASLCGSLAFRAATTASA